MRHAQALNRSNSELAMATEKRTQIRRSILQRARIELTDGSVVRECTMVDVSAGGARLLLATPDPLPNRFFLILSHDGAFRRLCSPAWQTDIKAGVQFIFN